MDIQSLRRLPLQKSILWVLLVCAVVVSGAALLARATLNLDAALIDKPDLAIYLLKPEVTSAELLRAGVLQREYIAETPTGPQLITLRKDTGTWRVLEEVTLHK